MKRQSREDNALFTNFATKGLTSIVDDTVPHCETNLEVKNKLIMDITISSVQDTYYSAVSDANALTRCFRFQCTVFIVPQHFVT